MRFPLRTTSLLGLAVLMLPVIAGAAAKVTLRDVVAIVQSNKKPLAFDITMRSSFGKTTGTLTVKGVQNGDMKTLSSAAAEATLVIEASDGTGGSGRADIRVILVDQILYARLEHVEAKGPWTAQVENLKPYDKKWYSFPIDPAEYEQYVKLQKNNRNASYKEIESFLQIMTEELRGGTTRYTVTIPKNKQRRLLSRILGPGYARTYRSPSIDARFTVDTIKNIFDAMSGSATIKTTIDGQKLSVMLSANTSALKAVPKIVAPENSTPWEAFIESQTTVQTEDARNAQRRSDVNMIVNAIHQYAFDNADAFPMTIPTGKTTSICKTRTPCAGASLDALLESYLVTIPQDPLQDADAVTSGYTIRIENSGKITIDAPLAEQGTSITVTR